MPNILGMSGHELIGERQMEIELNVVTLNLSEGNNASLHNARNVNIKCIEGIVWLTFDDLEGDFLLKKGEQMKIESGGSALMQALPFAKVKLT
jgi:hypothetical protein